MTTLKAWWFLHAHRHEWEFSHSYGGRLKVYQCRHCNAEAYNLLLR